METAKAAGAELHSGTGPHSLTVKSGPERAASSRTKSKSQRVTFTVSGLISRPLRISDES